MIVTMSLMWLQNKINACLSFVQLHLLDALILEEKHKLEIFDNFITL